MSIYGVECKHGFSHGDCNDCLREEIATLKAERDALKQQLLDCNGAGLNATTEYGIKLLKFSDQFKALKGERVALALRVERLETALRGVKSTARNCWCDNSADVKTYGHQAKCEKARAALEGAQEA